jgi:N-acyl-D-aspartate/D-glutamate deacylase
MSYDIKITGGTIIDGSGRARFHGDVGIRDGRIVDVGRCDGSADQIIDADGAIVAPGFTDLHTHYDGQVSWDADLAPSCNHGVTTCVFGNCGVGFAPVRERDRETLIALMEGVEDIPGTALAEGITWNWESFEDYMDALDAFPHTIDFCAQIPHDALRVFAMGERGVGGEAANEDDIALMRRLTRSALEAGAAGFSTGRSDNHLSADGSATPASESDEVELVGIARAFQGLDHGVLQAVSDFDMSQGPERFDGEFTLLERMLEAAGGRPMSISLMQRDQEPTQWESIISRAELAAQRGNTIRLQVAARAIGVMLGLEATFHPFVGFPSYKPIADLPLAERVARMREPAFRQQLLKEKSDKLSGDGSSVPPLADQLLANIDKVALRLFRLGQQPNYEPRLEDSIYAAAYDKGIAPLAAVYDALLEHDGHELLYFPLYNYTSMNLDNVHRMLTHPLALPGLSDGGAHVGTVCDGSFPTFLMTHWARDREKDRIPLETIIKMQAFDTARYIGLNDRGAIAPGQRADINIIDFDGLRLLPPRLHADLPAGGKRLLQAAEGYRATFVGGVMIAQDGKLTGKRPGRLARIGTSG